MCHPQHEPFKAALLIAQPAAAEDLATLRALEKQGQVEPDWNVNAYMRVETTENHRRSVLTDFVVRMLGLGICSDTEVRLLLANVALAFLCVVLPLLVLTQV